MKTCLITGGNAGIGRAAAIQMAKDGFRVIIACRNEDRGRQALEIIHSESGSRHLELILMDMSSLESIREGAAMFLNSHESLDVLIHNAADFDISRKKAIIAGDGIESVWATNHIGPVYLTKLLLDSIKNSEQGRILTVASKGLVVHPKLQVDLKDPEFKSKPFSVSKAYYQSKLAQVMYTYWLARELNDSKITVNCIRVTNVKIDLDRYPDLSRPARIAYSLKSRFSISPEKMARTYSWLASSPEVKGISGTYFNEKNQQVSSSGYSLEKENIDKMMKLTLTYLP